MRHVHTGAGLLLGAMMLCAHPAWGAGGYGPSAPTGPVGAPGGYTDVVTAQTVPVGGGNVSGPVAGGSADVTVRPNTFSTPVSVKITAPALPLLQAGLPSAGLTGWTAVAGIGVVVLHTDGTVVAGDFSKAVEVELTGPGIAKGERTVQFTTATSAATVPAHYQGHTMTMSLHHDPDLAVLKPGNPPVVTPARPRLTPRATVVDKSSSWGTPLRALGAVLALLVLVLVGGNVLRVRRR